MVQVFRWGKNNPLPSLVMITERGLVLQPCSPGYTRSSIRSKPGLLNIVYPVGPKNFLEKGSSHSYREAVVLHIFKVVQWAASRIKIRSFIGGGSSPLPDGSDIPGEEEFTIFTTP